MATTTARPISRRRRGPVDGRDGGRPEHDDHPAEQRRRAGEPADQPGREKRVYLINSSGMGGSRLAPSLTRVSGHEIAVPLALSFMAECSPRGPLLAGQRIELRLWDATTDAPVGSAVSIDSTTPDRGVLRAIALPLREFDLIYQTRVLGNLRGAFAWGVTLHLDIGG